MRKLNISYHSVSYRPAETLPTINLLKNGYDIRAVQELTRHINVNIKMCYTLVLNKANHDFKSPLMIFNMCFIFRGINQSLI